MNSTVNGTKSIAKVTNSNAKPIMYMMSIHLTDFGALNYEKKMVAAHQAILRLS